jgi:hypothetical protein
VHNLRFDKDGNLIVFDREPADGRNPQTYGKFYQVDRAGAVTVRYAAPVGQWIERSAIAADGGLLYQLLPYPNDTFYVAPGASGAVAVTVASGNCAFGAVDDEFGVLANQSFRKWSPTRGVHDILPLEGTYAGNFENISFDARGRLFLPMQIGGQLDMIDLATAKRTTVAGPGGLFLAGTTPEDSLRLPFAPAFDAAGAMALPDFSAKQIKRLPAGSF